MLGCGRRTPGAVDRGRRPVAGPVVGCGAERLIGELAKWRLGRAVRARTGEQQDVALEAPLANLVVLAAAGAETRLVMADVQHAVLRVVAPTAVEIIEAAEELLRRLLVERLRDLRTVGGELHHGPVAVAVKLDVQRRVRRLHGEAVPQQ